MVFYPADWFYVLHWAFLRRFEAQNNNRNWGNVHLRLASQTKSRKGRQFGLEKAWELAQFAPQGAALAPDQRNSRSWRNALPHQGEQ
jgi:hypothetical protein